MCIVADCSKRYTPHQAVVLCQESGFVRYKLENIISVDAKIYISNLDRNVYNI